MRSVSIFQNPFLLLWLICPLLFILAKTLFRWRISWVQIFFAYAMIGWLLLNAAHWFTTYLLEEQLRATPNPSDELLENLQNDGGGNVILYLFGWIHSSVYFLLWSPLIGIIYFLKYLLRTRETGESIKPRA
jgi:hypothetical protein